MSRFRFKKRVGFFLIALLCNVHSQEANSAKYITIKKENLSEQLNLKENQSILDYSRLGYALLYDGSKSTKVISLNPPFSINKNTKTFEFKMQDNGRTRTLLRFAPNDRFVIYKNRKKGTPTEIFDTLLNQSTWLDHIDDGDEQSVDAYNLKTFVYTSFSAKRRPRIYLVIDKEHHILTDGSHAIWSPNGEWILISEYTGPLTLKEKKRYGLSVNSSVTASGKVEKLPIEWSIYNESGKKKLQLKNINSSINSIRWSEDSNKLVCSFIGVDGFVLFTFKQDETNITVVDSYRFVGFADEHQRYTKSSTPTLSPNGDFIAFFKVTEDSDREIERRLYLIDTKTKELQDLGAVFRGSDEIKWLSLNQFIVNDGGRLFKHSISGT